MSLNDSNIKELLLTEFRGSDTTSDDYNLDPAHLNYAQNLDYTVAENGMVQAGTRTGTAVVNSAFAATAAVPSMASWLFVSSNVQTGYVAFLTFTGGNPEVVFWSQNSSSFPTDLVVPATTPTTVAANFAIDGLRIFFAFQSGVIGGPGTFSGEVYGVTPNAFEQLFFASFTATVTPTVGAASSGVITQGTHRIGYIFTTQNGYTGVLNPVTSNSSNTWAPVSFTTTDGTRHVTAVINFTGSFFGQTVQIVMTTAANLNTVYAVPGATTTISGANPTATIVVSITDADLAATGTNVTNNQNFLAATAAGTAPFLPSALFIYSSRMAYCTYDSSNAPVVYFSDQNNYQQLTSAFHGIYLEGRQVPIQGASLGGVCYIATFSGLYATQDNGGFPATWIPPSRVDGSVGILSSTCMSASTQTLGTATGRIILAAEKGLFIFKGGTFPEIPLSYWQTTDWNRINWATPWQVQVVDDVYRQKIRVLAPLKSYIIAATNANPIVITTAVLQPSATSNPLPGPHLLPAVTSILQVGATVTATGATSTTTGINTTGATLLVVTVSANVDITTLTVSDSNSNSWHSRNNETAGAFNLNTGIWYAFDKSGSALVVGAGHTATVTGGAASTSMTFSAFSGTLANHVDPYDSTAGQSVGNAVPGTTVQPGSITAIGGSLVVACFGSDGSATSYTVSASYTLGGSVLGGAVYGNAVAFNNNVTATNPTWTSSSSNNLAATIASFKSQSQFQVTITGVVGNTAANGTFTPTILSANTFSIPVAGNGAYTSGGIVTPSTQNAELTWTYPVGDAPGQPFYSLNSWAVYQANSVAIIRNITTELDETWYGPAATGKVLRRVTPSDALQYRDQDLNGNAVAINSIMETSLIPGTTDTIRTIHDYHGAHFRASGSGSLAVTAFDLDHQLSVVPAASPLTLNLTPGQEQLMKWFLRNEQQSIQLSTNATDAFFVVSRIKAYYTDSVPMR